MSHHRADESPGPPPGAGTALDRREKAAVGGLYVAILGATGLFFLLAFVVGAQYPAFIALGLISYVLGLRHGVDADHIVAIDNTTRKLLQEGKRPLSVGTFFSLGHSTVVVGLVVALGIATREVAHQIPALQSVGALVGSSVAGVFLYLIGLINVVIVLEIYRIFRGLRQGRFSPEQLEEQLGKRGFMNRYFGSLFRVIRSPWQIYPVGVLFGLGFDTATEIALIILAVGLSPTLPLGLILILPALFTVGMVLVDTTDAIGMRLAYGWAFEKPIRKVYYNLTITVISVLAAFVIGTLELLSVLAQEFHLTGGAWSAVATLSPEVLGAGIVVLFGVSWGVALLVYRWRRIDQSPPGRPPCPEGAGVG